VGGLSPEEYSKGLVGFSSLVAKGFRGYFLCTFMVFLLVILVVATNCLWCNCNCLWFK
jgi:hypothetical protein